MLPQGQGGEKRRLFHDRKQREKAKLQSRGVAFGGPGQLFGPPSSGSLQGHLGRKPRAGLASPPVPWLSGASEAVKQRLASEWN